MADTDYMVDIAQSKLQELVGKYAAGVCEAKQTVISEDCAQAHGPGMQDSLIAQTTETSMAVYNLDALADDNVAEDGEEGEDGGERRLAIDDEERDIVDLEAVGEVSHACSTSVGMSDDNDLVASINEFLGLG
jgi:hypothetical protein